MHEENDEDRQLQAQALKIETLLGEIEALPDPTTRGKVAEIVEGLLTLYGTGLAHILDIVTQQGVSSTSTRTIEAFAEDPLVGHLLLIHGLHPVTVEARVAQALEEVRPYLQSHGGNVELIGIREGVAHVRLMGHCNGCPSSTLTLRTAIETAIRKAAPDLLGLEADSATEQTEAPAAFVPMASLGMVNRK